MTTLQKNAISTIFENIFRHFSITHDALRSHPFLHKIYYVLIPLREFLSRNFSLKLQMYSQQKKHVNCEKAKEMLIIWEF